MSGKISKITSYIGIGSNLGNKIDHINQALIAISASENIVLGKFSKIVETKPLGGVMQPDYVNCVAQIKTSLTPEKLLNRLESLEMKMGRTSKGDGSSRTIDLDILLYGDLTVDDKKLCIPHPRMHLRSFVLDRLCDIDNNIIHPTIGFDVKTLAKRINGQNFVRPSNSAKLISIAGIVGVGKTTLARALSVLLDGELIEEEYDKNPYLDKVYSGRTDLSLQSELFFVQSSTNQLNKNKIIGDKIYISDYVFDKAFIYAKKWLNSVQLDEFMKLYPSFKLQAAKEVVVLYLTDKTSNCLERIKQRNRPYEMDIKEEFLCGLDDDYKQLFSGWKNSPVIEVDVSKVNFFHSDDVRQIAKQIKFYL